MTRYEFIVYFTTLADSLKSYEEQVQNGEALFNDHIGTLFGLYENMLVLLYGDKNKYALIYLGLLLNNFDINALRDFISENEASSSVSMTNFVDGIKKFKAVREDCKITIEQLYDVIADTNYSEKDKLN